MSAMVISGRQMFGKAGGGGKCPVTDHVGPLATLFDRRRRRLQFLAAQRKRNMPVSRPVQSPDQAAPRSASADGRRSSGNC